MDSFFSFLLKSQFCLRERKAGVSVYISRPRFLLLSTKYEDKKEKQPAHPPPPEEYCFALRYY